ncbi:hypothetical protein HUO09_13220 [Vibrio sp. Y2-5]|uniref:hypothetical protein n=1 Tax=Vibrio sp. Y2-5 TaxID=2743977 RepID=UPI00166125E7|nr:hypothetical protein [Vibrio sp. Y2-5]MBD0787309.1 hypothetical protein [Vibrio sp. Y2-5]
MAGFALLIPMPVIKWSEFCAEKTTESKAEFAVTSYSNYKNSNAAIGDFNKQ